MKGDKAKVPYMYLCVLIQKMENADGTEFWNMSSEKYVKDAVENFELKLANSKCRITSCCDTPTITTYHPSEDVTK